MDSGRLIVQLLLQHQDSALGVQVEERAALLVLPVVDGEQQLAVGVGVLGADLQDVLPGRGVLGDPHLRQQNEKKPLCENNFVKRGANFVDAVSKQPGQMFTDVPAGRDHPLTSYSHLEKAGRCSFMSNTRTYACGTHTHFENLELWTPPGQEVWLNVQALGWICSCLTRV